MQEEEEYVEPDSPVETFDEDGYADVLRLLALTMLVISDAST